MKLVRTGRGWGAWGSWSAAALVVLGCGGTAQSAAEPESAESSPPPPPANFGTLVKREAPPIERKTVKSPDGAWTARIEAQSSVTYVQEEGSGRLDAELGWDSTVSCRVFDGDLLVGVTVDTLLSAMTEKVTFNGVEATAVLAHGTNPIVYFRAVYAVNGDESAHGEVKLMVATRDRGALFCLHDAPGYSKSFERVTSNFVRSFEFKEPPGEYESTQLWVERVGEQPVGFTEKRVFLKEPGVRVLTTQSSQFVRDAPNHVRVSDVSQSVILDKKGEYAEGLYAQHDGSAEALSLHVTRKGTVYSYEGKSKDAPLSGTFKSPKALVHDHARDAFFASAAKSKKAAKLSGLEYIPWLDPKAATSVTYAVEPAGAGFVVHASAAKEKLLFDLDALGAIQTVHIPVGEAEVTSTLVLRSPAVEAASP